MPRARYMLPVLLAILMSSWAFAQESATREESLAQFLDEGWGSSLAARRAVDAQGIQLARNWPNDPQVEYARALALISQNRVALALPILTTLTAREEAPLAASRMLAWGQVATGDYAVALVTLEAYANLLVAENDLDGHEMDDAIRFTGRMIGFMDGPAGNSINANTVDRHARAILALYDARQTRLFDEAALAVAETYTELTESATTSREQAAEEEAERRQETRDLLAQQQVDASERLTALDEQRSELLDAAQEELGELEEELQPLEDEYADLEAQARTPQRQMNTAIFEIQRLQALLPDMPDGPQRSSTIDRIHDLQWYYNNARDELRTLSRQGDRIEAQVRRLAQRRAQVQGQYQLQLGQLQAEVEQINETLERNAGLQRRVSGDGTGNTSGARALAVRAASLSTYDELPLEAFKADLLAELANDGS